MIPSVKCLLLTVLAGATIVSAAPTMVTTRAATNFSGKGQIRTTHYEGDYEDLGCLTNKGFWTANESQCGTFTAEVIKQWRDLLLSSADGQCYIQHIGLRCGDKPADNNSIYFGIFPTRQEIGGGEALRYGQYGLMAGPDKYPPGPNDAPIPVQFWSSKDIGQKMVWLTWKAL
ncbi:hypothetical protein V8F06_012215 [Rhypophila decipiens]